MGENLIARIERFYEYFGAGDLDGAVTLFDPDIESVAPGARLSGIEAFRGYGEVFKRAFPDSRMITIAAIESGDMVAIEGVYTGTHTGTLSTPQGEVPPTGRAISLPYCDLFRFDGTRVVSHHVYYDQVTFLTQLGLMPEPEAVPA
jgi:ketosteroid isomerase-like protein